MNFIKKVIHTIFISITGFFIVIVLKFYFRKWQIANGNKIPHKGPVIFASNHQNALLDPLIIFFSQPRIPYFLVRADIFKNKTARFWLESLYMLPIYRVRDGIQSVGKNDEIILKCVNSLNKGNNPLVIFSEGNHNLRRSLRPLKKGIARIAFATMEANNFEVDLAVVPTGLNYGRHTRFRSDILINYGKPIFLKPYEQLYRQNPTKAQKELVNEIFHELDKVVLSIRPSNKYAQIENKWLHKRVSSNDLLEQFRADQKLILRISEKISKEEMKQTKEFSKEPIPPLPSLLYRIVMFPVFLYGYINSFIGYKLLSQLIKKLVTDIHFYGSMKSAINLVLAPTVFLFQTYIVYLFIGNTLISILYLISLPFAIVLAFDYKFAVFDRLPQMKGVSSYDL